MSNDTRKEKSAMINREEITGNQIPNKKTSKNASSGFKVKTNIRAGEDPPSGSGNSGDRGGEK